MAPRHALLSPALVGAVLAPALLFSFTSATPLAAAAPVTNVANGGFERGTTHWSAPGSKVKLSSTTSSWSGKRALKATATKRTPLRIRSERPVRPGTADKLRWSIRVKPSTARKVTLVVVERTASGAKKKHRTSTWAPARTWTKVNVTTKQRGTSSTFRQVLRTKGLKRGHAVAVDAAKVKQVRSNGNQSTQDKRTGTLSNGCSHSSRGLPECGGYLGMAYGSNSDPATLESEMDAQMGIRRTYYRADQVAGAVRTAKADLAKGRLPWVSFKFPHNWDQMNAGKGDAWAKSLAKQFAALDGPVWLAFHHEPENDGNIQTWRKVQERLATIVRNQGDNIAYTVVLTGWHEFYGTDEFSLAKIWPRGVKVDVAGFDVYNSHGVVKDGKELKATDMDGAYFAKIQKWAKQEGVAWGLAETGFSDKAFAEDPNWIKRTHKQLVDRDGVAFAYFNTTLNSISTWRLGEGAKWDSFRTAAKNTPRLPRS